MWNRIGAPAVVLAAALAASLLVATAPVTAQAARGRAADWTWLTADPATTPRWDPCTPITWSVNHDGSIMEQSMAAGFRKLARYTGYTYERVEYGGQITLAVVPNTDPTMVQLNALAYTQFGVTRRSDGTVWLASAQVTLSQYVTRPRRIDRAVPNLVTHELGHAMGLGHAALSNEAMFPGVIRHHYGAGDRAGLAAVRPSECAAAPVAASRSRSGTRVVV